MNPHLDRNLAALRSTISAAKPRKIDPDLKRDLKRGWLLPYLLDADAFLWQRWEHWAQIMQAEKLTGEPIPQITFCPHDGAPARKMLETCLNAITKGSGWQGWGSWQYFIYFLDWLLYGFGFHEVQTLPEEPREYPGASMRLYQLFSIETMLAYPNDYFGDILAENQHGRRNGFFPTPIDIVTLMVQMQCGEMKPHESVCDPACGTGRMLLGTSNYSYRLFGNDIDNTVRKACIVNGYLYAPWLARPFPFLSNYESAHPDAAVVPNIQLKYTQPDLLAL